MICPDPAQDKVIGNANASYVSNSDFVGPLMIGDSLYIEFKAESHNEVNLCGLFDSRSGGPTPS